MNNESLKNLSRDYRRVEAIIHYLDENHVAQPDLDTIARRVGISESRLQRLFSQWAGISPKRFLQHITLEHNKELLKSSHSILDVGFEAGLSSSSRVHDLFVQCHAVTPGEYRRGGEGMSFYCGFHPSPFGECLVVCNERGLTHLLFIADSRQSAMMEVKNQWPAAKFIRDNSATQVYVDKIFSSQWSEKDPLYVNIKGTGLQLQVWQALLKIPEGHLTTYEELAKATGKPSAVRAVANAVAKNPIHYMIPCHRVIRKSGAFGGYHGGLNRKKAIIGWESARLAYHQEAARA